MAGRAETIITRRSAIALGGAFAALAAAPRAAARGGDRSWGSLDRLAGRAIAERLVPGMQVSVMRGGTFVYSNGFGHANLETATPVDSLSVFRAGSLAKQVTGAAILLLAEDGKLSPDDRLERFVPDFPRAGDVSLRQMLTHTSGVGSPGWRAMMQKMRLTYDSAALLADMRAHEPLFDFEPGTDRQYSNNAYKLLGLVIERASGMPYRSFVSERLLQPSGMTRSDTDDDSEIVPGRVQGYSPLPGSASGFMHAPFVSMSYPAAAGALRTTADDLCRWHAALLWGRLLRPASLDAMLTPGRLRDGSLPTQRARAGANAPRETVEYGFGVGFRTEQGRRLISNGGGINGFLSMLASDPGAQISVACLVNSDDGRDAIDLVSPVMGAVVAEALRMART